MQSLSMRTAKNISLPISLPFLQGSLGPVIQEAAEVSLSVVKNTLRRTHPSNTAFLAHSLVHLHIPEGGTPKEGQHL